MIGLVAVALVSYLAGSIPFSYIAGKAFAGIDLREHGSGNLGASNTFRFLGAKIAIAVLVADVAKGFLPVRFAPVLAAGSSIPDHWLMLVAGFFTVIGHMFSVFVRFSGGKGIATTAGAFLAIAPWALAIGFGVWSLVMATTRIVSLASLTAAVALPLVVLLVNQVGLANYHWSVFALSVTVMIVVLVKHRSNIKRLLAGQEKALQRHKH